jgi:hypothetical protein
LPNSVSADGYGHIFPPSILDPTLSECLEGVIMPREKHPPETNAVGEDEIVEAMIESLRDPFPLTMLSVSGGIDRWREIMRTAYRAALAKESSADA